MRYPAYAPQPNESFNADANIGHGFAIFMANVGALRPDGLRRRLTRALGFSRMTHLPLSLRTGFEACFSADHYAIEISESHGHYLARAKRTSTRPCLIESEPWQEIAAAKAIALLEAVNAAIAQPENVTNGRSTTVYYAELDMPGRQLQVSSSALPREMLIELSSDSEANESLRSKAADILSAGYHVWAHELHSLASAFESELGKKYA